MSLTAAGAISEPDGTIAATTLSASAAAGAVTLGNPGNTIAVADGITATGGDLVLASATSMLLQGTLTGNDLTVTVAAAGDTLNFGTALLSANAAGRIALVADNFAAAAGASLEATGGAVDLAPFSTSEAFSLGATGGTLSLNGTNLPGFTADTLTIGGITGTPLAASVTIAAAIDLTGTVDTLDLLSLGGITDAAALKVGTLLADAGGSIAIGSTLNSINVLGSLTATSLTLGDAQPLTLDGPISATAATFDVTTLSEAAGATVSLGTLAGSGTLFVLTAPHNSIATLGSVTLSGDLTLAESGALNVAGPVSAADATLSAGTLGFAGSLDVGTGTLALGSAGTVSESGATIIAGTLAGSGTVGAGTIGGDLLLDGASNSIATLGSLTVGGNLTLADAHALSVNGPVGAANAALSAPTLSLAGSLDVGTGTLALGSSGTVSETGATITAGTLAGFGTIGGDLALGGCHQHQRHRHARQPDRRRQRHARRRPAADPGRSALRHRGHVRRDHAERGRRRDRQPRHAGRQRHAVRAHRVAQQHRHAGFGDAERRPDAGRDRRAQRRRAGQRRRCDAVGRHARLCRQPRCRHRHAGAGQRRHGQRERRHHHRRHAGRQRHRRRRHHRRRPAARRRQQQHRHARQPHRRRQPHARRCTAADPRRAAGCHHRHVRHRGPDRGRRRHAQPRHARRQRHQFRAALDRQQHRHAGRRQPRHARPRRQRGRSASPGRSPRPPRRSTSPR